MGRKVDWLFAHGDVKLGFGEAGKNDDATKKLIDGSFKMPKLMKSMFNNLCRKPSIVNKISIPTFLVMGKYIVCCCLLYSVSHLLFALLGRELTYKIMDCPGGYVCRINSLPPHSFPTKEINAVNLTPVLELILRAKALMENNLDVYDKAYFQHVLCLHNHIFHL